MREEAVPYLRLSCPIPTLIGTALDVSILAWFSGLPSAPVVLNILLNTEHTIRLHNVNVGT